MQNEKQQAISDEISLKDIVDFLKRNRWLIVIGGFAGLLLSAAYVFLVPNMYEAKGQLQMAQFGSANIEEPAALVHRLRFPLTYPVTVQQSCGMPPDSEFGDYLNGSLEARTIKSVASAVELKFRAHSVTQARQCAEAVVVMIVSQQHDLIEERLAGRHDQMLQYQRTLRDEQLQLEKINKAELTNFAYLAKLDKISWLRSRIDALYEEAMLSQKHPAKLTVLISSSSKPVSPKVQLVLLLGALLGSMLGMLYALAR